MPKAQRSTAVGAPSKNAKSEDTGVRVIRIPRSELGRDPFRYVSAPPTMRGDKSRDTDDDE